MATTHHQMTYCKIGCVWSGLLKNLGHKVYAQGPTHYQCIIGYKEMVTQTKKDIENIENVVRSNSKDGKYRQWNYGFVDIYTIEEAIKWKTENARKQLKMFEDHLNYHKTHEATKSSNQSQSLRKLLDMDKPQTQPPSPEKVCLSKLNQKVYHGASNHESKCADHTFWVYSPYLKLQNKWDTHLQVSTYCNHHIQYDANTYKCLGHTNPADFISAQKEWKQNGWTEEWVGVETLKEHANDEPEEMFVGKKTYISQ
jgi:hypothetical protein